MMETVDSCGGKNRGIFYLLSPILPVIKKASSSDENGEVNASKQTHIYQLNKTQQKCSPFLCIPSQSSQQILFPSAAESL